MNLNNIYKEMSTPLHMKAADMLVKWRNKSPSFPRKIVTGIATAALGIAGLIDIDCFSHLDGPRRTGGL